MSEPRAIRKFLDRHWIQMQWDVPKAVVRGNPDEAALLEQYKLAVELADRVRSRRENTNRFFVAVASAAIAVQGTGDFDSLTLGVLNVAGGFLAVVWLFALRALGQVNGVKFAVIRALEDHLPAKVYVTEAAGFQQLRYTRQTSIEACLPIGFAGLFCWLAIAAFFF